MRVDGKRFHFSHLVSDLPVTIENANVSRVENVCPDSKKDWNEATLLCFSSHSDGVSGCFVHLSPGNYSNGSNSANGPTNAGGTPTTGGSSGLGPYLVTSSPRFAVPLAAPVYSGSTPGVMSQNRPAFLYGVGIDFPAFSHFYFRVEYRGLGYKTPDFNQTGLQTNAYSFLSEPSFG